MSRRRLGRPEGFDFARDPLDAKKQMQTFDEVMKADLADKPKVMETQKADLVAYLRVL